jgi:YD repeat-containing protein
MNSKTKWLNLSTPRLLMHGSPLLVRTMSLRGIRGRKRCALLAGLLVMLAMTSVPALHRWMSEIPSRNDLARHSLVRPLAPTPQGNGYAYRRTITIDHTKVPNTDQSNFPLLISGTYSYLATAPNAGNVQNANGYDVIFTSDDGCATKLDHEVQTYSATTGAVNYWVRVPLLSHTNDTTIYICYGNSAITTDQSNKISVWDSNFKAVYHLDDQAASTIISDSTANGNNGVNAANTSGKTMSGKLGKALTYDGSTDSTATNIAQPTSFTWECWFKLTDWTTQAGSSNYSTLMASSWAAGGALLMLSKDFTWVVQFASDNAGGVTSGTNSIAPGAWHYAAYTRTGNNGTYALYFDGVFKGQVAGGVTNTSSTITLGTRADFTPQALNGLLDETRISNIARSADWIKTEYNNQSSPATFYSISANNSCCDTATARLDPMNATGGGDENPLSRNFNWTLPLVQLPGRAGLDLGISLAYNSLVWTKSGSNISFDDDHGFPSAGFRLGFPIIQSYFNTTLNQNGYMFLASDGNRVELRQVAATSLYQAVDSSYLLFDSSTMKLRTRDGTQLSYALIGNDYQCTEIKDRNGNYITINYTGFDRVDTVVDTLNRSIKFNYDVSNALTSITQTWTVNGSAVTHTWASFEYRNPNLTISTAFTGLTTLGVQNGSTIKVLSRVTLADSARLDFDYTSWGQVWKISRFANDGQTLLNYRSYNLPLDNTTAQTDCPRFTTRRDWAKYWNRDVSGVEQEAVTSYIQPTSTSWTMPDATQQSGTLAQVTAPDGTYEKIYSHSSGWDKGLPVLTETYDSSQTRQRQITTAWTQDNTALTIPLNPRVTETNTYDPQGNRKRVGTTYQQISLPDGTACSLPQDSYEYQADATTVLRSTRTTYNTSSSYTTRRIIGLVSEQALYEGDVTLNGTLAAKSSYQYDETGSVQGSDAPVQHDNTNYTNDFFIGRANLSSTKRYDVTNLAQFTTTSSKFNTAGAMVSSTDASGHTIQVSYADSFSDGVTRNTRAYPTTYTDPDGYTSTAKYNFDFGAPTYGRTPQPNSTNNLPGPARTRTYDAIGRLERITNLVNNAYTRYIYGPNYVRTYSTINTIADEAYSLSVMDGAGRVIATAKNHPASDGGYSGQLTVYDVMGRAIKTSNPTETSVTVPSPAAPINPYNWATAGDDSGWIYSQQTYDWKGRALVTTNQDSTIRTAAYSGCGCAGGEVVTIIDEIGRHQKVYSDVLGRQLKTEILNWNGTIYSTTTQTLNARDQPTLIRQWAGAENGGNAHQDTTMSYDGYGRLQSKHVPVQNAGSATVWEYNNDDTLHKFTDARGASATYFYNNARHLVNQIQYDAPTGITPTANVTFAYDAAGNKTSMSDGMGSQTYAYDSLSRLTSETRSISDPASPYLNASFTLSYAYNLAGELKSITDPWNVTINYGFDSSGRLANVTGINYSVSQLINSISYRAWGASKQIAYGNGRTASVNYNSRMQTSHFEIPSAGGLPSVMSIDYQYHADGRIRYSHNILDPRFDRSYEYDHATRIATALSGAEARGEPATTDRPYNESFAYDAFGHLTSRETESWSNSHGFWSNDSYSNDRRIGWVYDSQGNLTNNLKRQYTYDAAAQTVVISSSAGSFNQVFDGLGGRVKTTDFGIAKYYLKSTVLGEVISELDSTGAKQRSFVYAGGKLLAESGLIVHDEVSGTSVRKTDAQSGYTIVFDELDPMGADAYTEDPYIADPNFGGRGEGGAVYPGYGNISDPSRGCTSGGIYGVCDQQPDIWFWGNDIASLPGFGTNWGSFGQLAEWKYQIDLAFTLAAIRERKRKEKGVGGLGAGLGVAMGNPQNTGELRVLDEAQTRVTANYDECRRRVFGNEQTFADRNIIGREEAVLALFAGGLGTDRTAMVAGIWGHESNFVQRPDGDAGPAQLTSWWRNNQPGLIVGNAYGTWHGRTHGVPFDGNVRDNLATLGNIVRFSRDRYGNDRDIPYWYGPGDPGNPANATRNRNEYADHVMQLYGAYQRFFDCLAGS